MLILGLDPGSSTGVATFIDGALVHLRTVDPAEMIDAIRLANPQRVIFEDSRLQSHTWTQAKTRAAALKMARNVGEIDAWCKLIVATCDRLSIAAHGISPKGKGAKLDATQFAAATGWVGRSNEHERDAAMVAWKYRRGA